MGELQSSKTTTHWVYRDGFPVYRNSQSWVAVAKAEQIASNYPGSRIEIKSSTYEETVTAVIEPRLPYEPKPFALVQ